MTKDYDSLYQIKKTVTMSQQLVAKDSDFALYVGASPEVSQTLALINVVLQTKGLISEESKPTLEFLKTFLHHKNKALFASLCSELSKISFYLGLRTEGIDAIPNPEASPD